MAVGGLWIGQFDRSHQYFGAAMSIGILFEASREVRAIKSGEFDIQRVFFEVYTPPSGVCHQIHTSMDPVQTYKDWIRSQDSFIYETEEFAEDDVLCENPIGRTTVDPRIQHLQELEQWQDMLERGGWDLQVVLI